MTRMTGPDCVVMCNLINTYIQTYIHTYRGNLPSLLERLPERPMASALLEELKIVATKAKRSQIEDAVGSSWAALAVEEDPQGRGIGSLLVEARAGGGGGGGEGEREGRGAWGRGCWTARTMGGSDGNPV